HARAGDETVGVAERHQLSRAVLETDHLREQRPASAFDAAQLAERDRDASALDRESYHPRDAADLAADRNAARLGDVLRRIRHPGRPRRPIPRRRATAASRRSRRAAWR